MTQIREIAERFAQRPSIVKLVDDLETIAARGTLTEYIADRRFQISKKEIRSFRETAPRYAFLQCFFAYIHPSNRANLGYDPLPPEQKASELAHLWANNDEGRWNSLFAESIRIVRFTQSYKGRNNFNISHVANCIASIFSPGRFLKELNTNKNILHVKGVDDIKVAEIMVSAFAQKVNVMSDMYGPMTGAQQRSAFVKGVEELMTETPEIELKIQLAQTAIRAVGNDLSGMDWKTLYFGFDNSDLEIAERAYCELYRRGIHNLGSLTAR